MYFILKISEEASPESRRELRIQAVCDEEETKRAREGEIPFAHCVIPVPTETYATNDPQVRTLCVSATRDGNPFRAYFLPKAPKAPMSRALARKTALRVPSFGETSLGFINPREVPLWERWWEQAKGSFSGTAPKRPGANTKTNTRQGGFAPIGTSGIVDMNSAANGTGGASLPAADANQGTLSKRRSISALD
jgi:hypothetical protein